MLGDADNPSRGKQIKRLATLIDDAKDNYLHQFYDLKEEAAGCFSTGIDHDRSNNPACPKESYVERYSGLDKSYKREM